MSFRIKFKKIMTRIGIVIISLIALGLVIRGILNYHYGKKLEKSLAAVKAKGIPLSIKELEPDCPREQNAASYWKAAEALFNPENKEAVTQAANATSESKPLTDELRFQLQEVVTRNQEVLRLIQQASKMNCFKYDDNWDLPIYESQIANLVKMLISIRIMGFSALFKAEEGDIEKAVEQCLAAKRFLQLQLQEPHLINYLVITAGVKHINFCLEKILSGRELKNESLRNLISEWDPESWKMAFPKVIRIEQTDTLERSLDFLRGRFTLNLIPSKGLKRHAARLFYWIFRPLVKKDIIFLTEFFDEKIRLAKMPYWETQDQNRIDSQKVWNPPWYSIILDFSVIPSTDAIALKLASLEALFHTTQMGLACKLYKNLNGEYPEELSQLVPDILDELPLDPFTGKSYVYRRHNGGFIVYSLGSNQKDDGGRESQITQMIMEKDDDWAWKEKGEGELSPLPL